MGKGVYGIVAQIFQQVYIGIKLAMDGTKPQTIDGPFQKKISFDGKIFMKTQFKDINFKSDSLAMITTCNTIIDEYLAAGLRLTLRQLYYQFVARDLFPNDRKWRWTGTRWVRDPNGTKNAEPNYKWLSTILSDGRLTGLVDWSAIEDRGRQPKTPNESANLAELIETAVQSYRLPRWEGQEYYTELWCFPPLTSVTTPNGVMAIGSLEIGDKVIDRNGDARKILHIFRRPYRGKLVEIKICGLLPFQVTPNHPFLVETAIPNSGLGAHRKFNPATFIPADQIKPHDKVFIPRNLKILAKSSVQLVGGSRTWHEPLIKIDESFCKVAGLYLAEGSVRGDNRTLQFTFNKNEDSYAQAVKTWSDNNGFHWNEAFGQGTRIVYVFGKAASNFFGGEFGNGSYNKHFPEWAMYLPFKKQLCIMQYYFRGDASLWDESRSAFSASTRSEVLARQLQLLFMRCGYGVAVTERIDHGKPMFGVVIAGEHVEKIAPLWNLPVPHRKYRFTHLKVAKNCVVSPVRIIKEIDYEGEVINLKIEGTNSYCVPCIVHNCEKDALAGVIAPTATEFHATLMVNKGYSSQSAMYESAHRFINSGRRPLLLYLGDHDPSGEDMVRDIRDRLILFGVEEIEVRKLALTMDQIHQYNPPPNPTKVDDPRAASYISEFGNSSWEVDALPPQALNDIIREAFEGVIDSDLMDAVKKKEEAGKRQLRSLTGKKKKK